MMKYVPRDIRQIKLMTGEEILTEVVGEDHVEFLIRNPLKIHKERMILKGVPREANYFTRWMGLADNPELIISKTHIVAEAIVDDNVAAYYNKMMANIEQDDEVTLGSVSEAENPEFLSTEEEDTDKPTFH